jgi:hypothetical protein
MPIYHAAFTGKAGTNTANTPLANLASLSRKLRVREVGIFIQVAPTTAPILCLQRATTRGTQTTALAPLVKDSTDSAATASLDVAWSSNPAFTNTNPFLRAIALPVTAGNGMVWDLEELEIVTPGGLILFNNVASGATVGSYCGYFEYEE